jgi:hypothetical protein
MPTVSCTQAAKFFPTNARAMVLATSALGRLVTTTKSLLGLNGAFSDILYL